MQKNINQSLEDFITLTRDLACENDINKLLGEIIKENILITQAQGGKVYLPDVTKKYFELKHICLRGELQANEFREFAFRNPLDSQNCQVSRASLQSNGIVNSNNYLIFSTITGSLLQLQRRDNFSSYKIEQISEFDREFDTITDSVLVMPLCDHEGITIGLLELYNYNEQFDYQLLKAFTSLSAVLINNTNLVTQNHHLISVLDESNLALADENDRLKKSINKKNDYAIIGNSQSMRAIYSLLDKVVDSNVTVLIRGETGTGKEIFAREIHNKSPRKNQAFISQNCAALPENLLESELFGYRKGAFTGADGDKPGLFDQANGGSLFLDEIGDMPVNLQAKVLRVIQEKEIRPLGSSSSHKIDVRLIAATHCDLEEKISKGEFRQDLFYRLNIFPIKLPRLCERGNDIVLLIKHFIDHFCSVYGRSIHSIAPNTIDALTRYHYPGNVRELQNIIERSVLLCNDNGSLLEEHLPGEVVEYKTEEIPRNFPLEANVNIFPMQSLKRVVQKYEAALIKDNLKANDWNQTLTAKVLKLPRRTLVEKISRLNIVIPK